LVKSDEFQKFSTKLETSKEWTKLSTAKKTAKLRAPNPKSKLDSIFVAGCKREVYHKVLSDLLDKTFGEKYAAWSRLTFLKE
jgi:hypothetical protein